MTELESCPACGALPCDWVFNPNTDPESALVAREKAHQEYMAFASDDGGWIRRTVDRRDLISGYSAPPSALTPGEV